MSRRTIARPEQSAPEQQSAPVAVSTSGAAQQNTLRNIGLIIPYEYKKRVTQRSFIISTVVLLVLIAIASFVPTIIQLITAHTNSQTKIAVVNNANTIAGLNGGALTSYINTALNGTTGTNGATGATNRQNSSGNAQFVVQAVSDGSQGAIDNLKNQVKNGSLGILLVIDRAPNGDLTFTYYTTSNATDDANLSQVQSLASQLTVLDKSSHLGLTPAQTSSLFAPPPFSDVNLAQAQSARSTSDIVTGYILAYVGFILVYFAVTLYGSFVANGVAEEKSSRIMEILVNAATPFQLMVGKVVGIGAAGLSQMALFVVVGIGALLLQIPLGSLLLGRSTAVLSISITGASITMLVLVLVYFILGFLLYATLFAAMGALVKRQDEVQNAIQPLTIVLVAGYLVNFYGVYAPDSILMRVVSYIPLWTPMAMLVRVGVGTVAWWEIPLTIVLMIAAIFVCTVIAARIYRFGVLMYGQRPGLRQLFRLVRTG